MRRPIGYLALAVAMLVVLAAPVLAGTAAAAPAAQVVTAANRNITLTLNSSAPNSYVVSGALQSVPADVVSAVVTLTLNNGQIATQVVGPSTGWGFVFTNIPADGWKTISVSETSTSSVQYVNYDQTIPAYVYSNPYVLPTYNRYTWTTGYPTYTYPVGAYTYNYYYPYQLGYLYQNAWNSSGISSLTPGYGYYWNGNRYVTYNYYTGNLGYSTAVDYSLGYRYNPVTTSVQTYYYNPYAVNTGVYLYPGTLTNGTTYVNGYQYSSPNYVVGLNGLYYR